MKEGFKISCESSTGKAIIRISGRISQWNNHAEGFKAAVDQAITAGLKNVEIYLNSPGGEVFEANEIGNEIERFTGNKTAILGAMCASAATYIASICDKVIAKKNTQYMIHKPMAGFVGNADEIEASLKLLRNLQGLYAETYSKKTGLPVAKITEMWVNDFWMNAEEAKTKKFIDEVEGTTADLTSEDIAAITACGYKDLPKVLATAKSFNPIDLPTPQNKIMKDKILLLLAGVAGITVNADTTDTQLIAHLDNLKARALKADTLQAQLDALKKTAKDAEIKAVLDVAEGNKQITAAEREYYTKALTADFDGTKAHIEAKPKATQLSTVTTATGASTGGEDRAKWTYENWQEKDPKGLAEMAEKDEAKFKALYKANYGVDL